MARKIFSNVEIGGKTISPISHLSIIQPLNGHHRFELRCPLKESGKSLMDASNNFIGKEIKIELASGAAQGATNQFVGHVTGVSLSKHHGIANEIVYTGHCPTLLMDDWQHCQSFEEKKIDEIAKAVVGNFGISIEANPSYKDPLPYFVQYRETAYMFLSRLADAFGEWFFYDGTKLIFGKAPKEDPVELMFGRDLYSFDLGLNLAPLKFKQLGYDYLGHKFPESSATAASISELDDYGKIASKASDQVFTNEPVTTSPYDIHDKNDLDELTKHQKNGRAANMVLFNGTSDNNQLKLGCIITIKGKIGDVSDFMGKDVAYGEYRVIKISHSTDALGNYQNTFVAIPSSLKEPPTNTLVRLPICEVQPADVMENHDSKGLGRVRVQLRWQQPNGNKTPWIRVAASGAGGTHGSFFVPEKGDQVLVAFEHNNPDKPYVVGTLYHGKAKPHGDLSNADNNKKIIKTKSGNKIALNDEGGKEEIKIESGTNVITLTMDGDLKITIKTLGNMMLDAKNITLKATETITIDGPQKISLISTAEKLTLDGTGTTNSLEGTAVTVKGTATAEVTAPNTTVNGDVMNMVKGGMVKLN